MNTNQITKLLKSKDIIRPYFKGVFAIDTIPKKIDTLPTSIVINLDTSKKPGSHWVVVYLSEYGKNEYFDSYGFKPIHYRILKLLGDNYLYNASQLQSFITTVCGQYCIFYIWKKCNNWSMEKIINFFSNNCFQNDYLVNEIIETYFDVNLNTIDASFFLNQKSTKYLL